jgi:hypothetical protein
MRLLSTGASNGQTLARCRQAGVRLVSSGRISPAAASASCGACPAPHPSAAWVVWATASAPVSGLAGVWASLSVRVSALAQVSAWERPQPARAEMASVSASASWREMRSPEQPWSCESSRGDRSDGVSPWRWARQGSARIVRPAGRKSRRRRSSTAVRPGRPRVRRSWPLRRSGLAAAAVVRRGRARR